MIEHCNKMSDRISRMADKIIKWLSSVAKNDRVHCSHLQMDEHCSSGKWLSAVTQWKMIEQASPRVMNNIYIYMVCRRRILAGVMPPNILLDPISVYAALTIEIDVDHTSKRS
jgi:protein involved in temperature-dependent protein secretion